MNPKEQALRDALALRNRDEARTNLSIKAGAGAGKTTLLSMRICEQILEGVELEQFVIITYTNAAAAELRDKIASRLAGILQSESGDSSKRAIAQDALHNIERIQISTIHSFLLKILKENAFAANIVLDCRMLEAEEDEARQIYFFNRWYEKPETQTAIQEELYGSWVNTAKTNGSKKDITLDIFMNMFQSMANVREEIVCALPPQHSDLQKEVDDFVARWLPPLVRFKEVFEREAPIKKSGEQDVSNDYRKKIDCISDAQSQQSNPLEQARNLSKALLSIFETLICFKNGIAKTSFFNGRCAHPGDLILLKFIQTWHDANAPTPVVTMPAKGKVTIDDIDDDDVKKCLAQFPTDRSELDMCLITDTIRAARVAGLIQKVKDDYQAEIDSKTTELSNDDILFRAQRLLTSSMDILDKYRMKYSKIYVDEFQDTTRLQANLITMLAEVPGTKPEEHRLQSDKLVVVGDPKQSIYRFTGAEIDVYNSVDSLMNNLPDAEAQSKTLDYNFRSNESIVSWVNAVFPKLMPVDPISGASTYSHMETDWTISDSRVPHGVFYYDYEKEDSFNDFTAVANLILRMVGHEYCCAEEYDNNTKARTYRPLQYSDFMIITKVATNMSSFVTKFSEMNIPVDVQGKIKIKDDEILWNFILLTDYLAEQKNRKTRLTAAQVLQNIDVTCATTDECKKAEKKLSDLFKTVKAKKLTPAAVIQHLLSEEDLFMDKDLPQHRVREIRIRLHQMTETCLRKNTGDLHELVAIMRKYMESEVSREIPLERRQNAVRLMNVHKAKGLTSRIVIIADRRNNEDCRYSSFKKGGKYYPSASFKPSKASLPTYIPAFRFSEDIMTTAANDENDEAIRLQYVAATRAAQALIIMPNANSKEPHPWFSAPEYRTDNDVSINSWLKSVEPEENQASLAPVQEVVVEPSNSEEKPLDIPQADPLNLASLYQNADNRPENLLGIQQISITPSELEDESIKTGCTKPTDKELGDPDYEAEDRPYGNIFGLVMHRVYELMVGQFDQIAAMDNDKRDKCIERLINLAILENADMVKPETSESFRSYLKPIMLRYFDEVLKPIMDDASEVYTEYCFSFFVDEDEKADFMKEFAPYFKIKEPQASPPATAPDSTEASTDDDTINPYEDDTETSSDADTEEPEDNDSEGTKKGEKTEETREEKNAKAIIMNSGSFAGKIWVNGQADLVVVKKDGTIKVYDYKSNKRNGKPLPDFRDRLNQKYEGQLKLYRYAIAKTFSNDTTTFQKENIQTELIDLYG